MQPLAERLRPRTLDEYIGQKHLVGPGAVLRKMIDAGRISSFILWGPPGVGKTTLAQIIANKLETPFYTLSAVTSGVKDVRDVIERAKSNRFFSQASPILFIDEIHRFSKSQQDSLLGAVEQGTVTLIGATTENPSFEVIRPLLSRCQLYTLKSLEKDDLLELLQRAITTDTVLKERKIELKETTAMLRFSGGDARKLLNILELVIDSEATDPVLITDDMVTERLQQNPLAYDKDGEMHYDIISAFIKSIRGSDPDGAIYWLARMVEGGEDPALTDEWIEKTVAAIHCEFPDCAITLSLGEKSREAYERFFRAGANRYLLRHETHNEQHYRKLHPEEMSLKHRLQCLQWLKEIGYQTGTGIMVGSPGQTLPHLVEDLLFIEQFHPQMIGIGPFIPHHETPFGMEPAGSVEMTLKLLSLFRLMHPSALIPSTTALATLSPDGREKGILAGANVVMPNLSPREQREKYALYDNKAAFGAEAAEGLRNLAQRLETIGYRISTDRGDYH